MRIVVCDDHRLLLEALTYALGQEGFTIEAATSHPAAAVAAVELYDPDLLLIDLGFPEEEGDGLSAAREVGRNHPRTRVVIITGSDDPAPLLEAMKIGVAGYVRKDQRLDGIVEALRRAADGRPAIDKTLVRRLGSAGAVPPRRRTPFDRLTDQERVVLGYLADGLCTSDIIARMGISNSTVRSHIQATLTKLGVHSRLQAVALVHESGWSAATESAERR
jgi:two-component system, NarL family, nitrate/nitrite response regulator NarL